MLSVVLHSFIGTQYCLSHIKNIILNVFENNCPLHNFILLLCRIAKIINMNIEALRAKIMLNWGVQLYALLVSCFIAEVPTSFTF